MPGARSSLFAGLLLWSGAAGADGDLRDLWFGEALYEAAQENYFDALQRLDAELMQHRGLDEPALDSLYPHVKQAEFFVGDFELNYRMHHRAGRAIEAVLEGAVEPAIRNEAAYRLARIHFQKGQHEQALEALERIDAELPRALRDDVDFLRANVQLALGQPSRAIATLKALQADDELRGFSAFNLGIALLQAGKQSDGLAQLDRAGRLTATGAEASAIRDQSNLVLGSLLMDAGDFVSARDALDRVRLQGPHANRALLSSGWADLSAQRFERAVVPWSLLVERNSTDEAVQEALLALPFAYAQLGVHGRAAVLYGEALDTFIDEHDKLDASIRSVREGRFLEALVREEIHQDKDWVIRLRSLPETPETFYLTELMARHEFQTGLQNYLDLEELRRKLENWSRNFAAYEDLIAARRAFYEPLLPEIDHAFRQLDSRMRLRVRQYELLARRLEDLLVVPRPEFLASTDERLMMRRLDVLRAATPESEAPLRARIERLQGVLTFLLRTEYDDRLTTFHEHLGELAVAVDALAEQYDHYVRIRQAASHSYEGYQTPLRRLAMRVQSAQRRVEQIMARQGHLLERVAIRELEIRKERLRGYQRQARYALADSYDRAARAQKLGSE